MKERRLAVALGISAAVHLAVLGSLVAVTPRPGRPAMMRVHVLSPEGDRRAREDGIPSSPVEPPHSAQPSTGPLHPAAPPPPDRQPAPARSRQASGTPSASPNAPVATVTRLTPVQSDIWVLTQPVAEAETTAGAPPAEGTTPPTGGGASTESGVDAQAEGPGPAAVDGQQSLLAELARRLAQSAARCTPRGAARRGWEGDLRVPVHFCLDPSGRPREIGLQGTTGSNLLDRTALECVVPGAAPLPSAPGCYTVEVRFPIRG